MSVKKWWEDESKYFYDKWNNTVEPNFKPSFTTIAIPVELLEGHFFVDNATKVLVILKKPIYLEKSAGARHQAYVEFPILPRGGIRIFKVEPPREYKVSEDWKEYIVYQRVLPFARLYFTVSKKEEIEEAYQKPHYTFFRFEGYLVFKQISEDEMKLCTEKPEYVLWYKVHDLWSRSHAAKIKLISEPLWAYTSASSTRIASVAVGMAVIPMNKDFYYAVNYAPYRGDESWTVYRVRYYIEGKEIKKEEVRIGETRGEPEDVVQSLQEEEII